jgi:hypothetical protein
MVDPARLEGNEPDQVLALECSPDCIFDQHLGAVELQIFIPTVKTGVISGDQGAALPMEPSGQGSVLEG